MFNRYCAAVHLISGFSSNHVSISRTFILARTMTTPTPTTTEVFTTNDDDKNEVAKLQARLKDNNVAKRNWNVDSAIARQVLLPSVEIAEGVHKYVLIRAELEGEQQYIVTSKNGAAYHRNAAEPMIDKLQNSGYTSIEVTGGGRISYDKNTKEIHIYGFSYGFGLADHSISQRAILDDPRYSSFNVTYSNEGY
jgi:phosphohistidine phosphatase